MWALPELIEAAVRNGDTRTARDALERLAETTQAGGTDYGLGLEARSRALLSDGEAADGLYRQAIDRLSRTRLRPELARAHLLYGEWLRREGRRADARTQLRTAYQILAPMGAAAFAERARRELLAARRDRAQPRCADPHRAHRPGSVHRPARARRPDQHRDRSPAVSQRPHGRMAPGQRVHQARNQLAPRATPGAGGTRACGPAIVASAAGSRVPDQGRSRTPPSPSKYRR